MIKNIILFPYRVYAFLLFVVTMLIAFCFIMACVPFGPERGGKMIYYINKVWGTIWFFMIGIRWQVVGKEGIDHQDSFIYIANHGSYLDAAFIFLFTSHQFRALGKVELSKIPIFGLIYKTMTVTVDRSSKQNRGRSVRVMKLLLKKGISIFIFPEGTFNETENDPLIPFYDGAFRIAIETETSIVPIVLTGLQGVLAHDTWLKLCPGKITATYLPPVDVSKYTAKEMLELKQLTYDMMDAKIRELSGGGRS